MLTLGCCAQDEARPHRSCKLNRALCRQSGCLTLALQGYNPACKCEMQATASCSIPVHQAIFWLPRLTQAYLSSLSARDAGAPLP